MSGKDRAKALPFFGEGEQTGPRVSQSDDFGAKAVVLIFVRIWPYLLPQIVGHWRELTFWGSRQDSQDSLKPAATSSGLDFRWYAGHVPIFCTFLVVLVPFFGLFSLGQDLYTDLVWGLCFVATALSWILLRSDAFVKHVVSIAIASTSSLAVAVSFFLVEGASYSAFSISIALSCASGLFLQCRTESGRLVWRVRVGSHLIYYFVLLLASTLLSMLLALFSVDLISQSILQAKPLTPFLANFIGQPELAGVAANPVSTDIASAQQANVELAVLSDAQRQSLTWIYGILMVFLWLAQVPTMMLLPYYYIFIMQRINQALRTALLVRWHRLSMRYHSDHRVGDSVYRLYQDSAQVTAVVGTVTQVLQILLAYSTAVFVLFALDPILGFMTLSIVAFALLWGLWYSPRMRTRSLASRIANSAFTSRVQEVFAAVRHIKALGTAQAEQQRLEHDSVAAFNASYRVRSLVAVVGIVMFTLAAGALLVGQFLTAVWAFGERETFAAVLVGFVGLSFVRWNLSAYNAAQEQLGLSSVAVRDIVEKWTQAQDMAMGLNRVFDILDIEPDVQNRTNAFPMPPFKNSVEFENVSFAYERGRPVLSDISFTATAGSITAIVGPTGSGKTSLVSLLFRLFDPDSGSLSIDGHDIRDFQLDTLRNNISVALQENVLFGVSVRDNIGYVAPDANDARIQPAAWVACADEYIESLPDGIDTILSDRGGKLSSGQRQRLTIARAVAKDSPILVLDEPTAALDAATEHRVLDRLAEWGKGRAIFLITHRISTIQRADKILFLEQGRIVEQGSHAELLSLEGGRYRSFFEIDRRLSNTHHAV